MSVMGKLQQDEVDAYLLGSFEQDAISFFLQIDVNSFFDGISKPNCLL